MKTSSSKILVAVVVFSYMYLQQAYAIQFALDGHQYSLYRE